MALLQKLDARRVPYLSRKTIERDAAVLLREYEQSSALTLKPPIPIEDIIEKHLQLTLDFDDMHTRYDVPRPANGETTILGAIYGDGRIFIDSSLDPDDNPSVEGRYRFTLAHEGGRHWRLHQSLLKQARWGGDPTCTYCGSTNTARTPHRHHCYDCKTSFRVTVGTIFHRTHLPLQKWFLAITLMLNAKKGLSALQLSRDLGVNKNTAWRIAMQIRKAMTQAKQRSLLTGIVEMDEAYIGGKPRKSNRRPDDRPSKRGRGTDKAPVIGAVERGSKVTAKATVKEKMKSQHMRSFVRERVDASKTGLITDEYKGYLGISKVLPHAVIKHRDWYVNGIIHTNTIEGFWALLKRGMFGQFHSVSRRRLQRYVDEFCYRYNLRNTAPLAVFDFTIKRGLGVTR